MLLLYYSSRFKLSVSLTLKYFSLYYVKTFPFQKSIFYQTHILRNFADQINTK